MEIRVHIGPPKTGTSAIQKWCLDHKEELLKNGIYYPAHDVDVNGVSSGNLLCLYELDGSELVFSVEKYQNTVANAKEVGANTILLSSEFFFKRVPEIAVNITNAIFLAYIRFELNIVESSYNQTVKRHKKSSVMVTPSRARSQSLGWLKQYLTKFGADRFILRAYDKRAFYGGNITSDLLKALNYQGQTTNVFLPPNRVNAAYSLECLEYKRWFNKFDSEMLQGSLDSFLQKQSASSNTSYSILTAEDFKRLKAAYLKELSRFCNDFSVANSEELLKAAKNSNQDEIVLQHIDLNSFRRLTKCFLNVPNDNVALLVEFLKKTDSSSFDVQDKIRFEELERLVFSAVPRRMTFGKVAGRFKSLLQNCITPFVAKKTTPQSKESCNTVRLLSHNIPYTTNRRLLKDLELIYGKHALYHAQKHEQIRQLNNGEKLTIPIDTRIIHGHFKLSEEHIRNYPNALNMLWVRDPLERLWIHFEYAINLNSPSWLNEALLMMAKQKNIVRKEDLFKSMLESDKFNAIKFIYANYIKTVGIDSLDFVGTVHKYDQSIEQLSNMLSIAPIEMLSGQDDYQCILPKNIRKFDLLLSKEYELVDDYL